MDDSIIIYAETYNIDDNIIIENENSIMSIEIKELMEYSDYITPDDFI